jgi:hypothetical protein
MMTTDEICPPPERCIADFLRDIDLFAPNPDQGVRDLADWLRALRDDRESLGVLDAARRVGADVPRLLLAGGVYRGNRVWLDGPLANMRIGVPGGVAPEFRDINELLEQAEAVERALHRGSADAAEVRAMKSDLDRLDDYVRQQAGEPRPYLVPDGRGGWTQKQFVAHCGVVAMAEGEIGPAQGPLRSGRGAHGDHALDVLMILVMGHLLAVTHQTKPSFVVDLVLRGLRIGLAGPGGGAADAGEAMRLRLNRCRGEARQAHRERAQTIARMLRLRYEPA